MFGRGFAGLRRSSFGSTNYPIRANSSAPSFSESKNPNFFSKNPRRPSFGSRLSEDKEETFGNDFSSLPRRSQLFRGNNSPLTRHHSFVDRGAQKSPFSIARTNSDVSWDELGRFRSFRKRSPKLEETDVEETVSFFFSSSSYCL